MKTTTRMFGALAAVVLFAAACGDDDDEAGGSVTEAETHDEESEASDETTEPDGDTTEPGEDTVAGECPTDSGGTLNIAARNEPQGLDPFVGGTTGSQGGIERVAFFDTIMQYDPETGEYEGRMAESLEPNDDATEWTLTLRDDVTFANGEPLNAEAVVFTVDRHRAEDSTSLRRTEASQVESMEIVDDHTVVFTLTEPWGNFPTLLTGAVGMVQNPATFQELGDEAFAADPQDGGAGPFRLENWSPGEEMVLTARDDYWGGEVCIDSVRFTYGLDDVARYDAFQLGELDMGYMRLPEEVARAREDGVSTISEITNGGFLLQMNHGARGIERAAGDVRVRQAIAYAIDPDFIDGRGFGGEGMPDKKVVPETSLLYSDEIEEIPYDPDRAREILDEAKADGYDGSIHFTCNTTYNEPAIAITALLEDVGFDVNLDAAMSVQEWAASLVETEYEIACGSLQGIDARPWASMAVHFSGMDNPASLTGYDSEAQREAMGDLKAALTPEERQEAFAEVHRVWNEEAPSVVYGHSEEVFIYADHVAGLDQSSELIIFLDDVVLTN